MYQRKCIYMCKSTFLSILQVHRLLNITRTMKKVSENCAVLYMQLVVTSYIFVNNIKFTPHINLHTCTCMQKNGSGRSGQTIIENGLLGRWTIRENRLQINYLNERHLSGRSVARISITRGVAYRVKDELHNQRIMPVFCGVVRRRVGFSLQILSFDSSFPQLLELSGGFTPVHKITHQRFQLYTLVSAF